jgi:hypothetical protein
MLTEGRQLLSTRISWGAAICLALGGLFVMGCDRSADSSTSSSPMSRTDSTTPGAMLRAEPNPVPAGNPPGKTTITWATGSDAPGDVYVVNGANERLFATGSEGTQDAPWIQAGSTEFRLYNHADHKLLSQVTVTMPSADVSATRPLASP